MTNPDVHPANIRFLFKFSADHFNLYRTSAANRFLFEDVLHSLGYHHWWPLAHDRNQHIGDPFNSVQMRVVPQSVVIRKLSLGASPFMCEYTFFPKR